ncbi:YesL family protein [Gottfriedia sp. NPDC057948]|uniref:YesL family protein n=1 Tax=Gottfriedia sp. NPDC057948 TaxID=3346287 RepID=UPI0036DB3A1E
MNILNSRFLQFAEKIVDLFLLNILWLIMCIPVITIFPATVSMYGVIRKWTMGKETNGVFRTFLLLFRECFLQSFGLSVLWVTLGFFIYIDFRILHFDGSLMHLILLGILCLLSLFFISITVYLFPIMAHFDTNWKNVIKNSITLVTRYPLLTILLIMISFISLYLVYLLPLFIFILGSVTAYFSYTICHKLFLGIKKN